MSEVDVLVIGGGFSGLGIATKVGCRGYRVMLCEAGEIGGETSANSHQVVHGGFRYLQSLSLRRVYESAYAQAEIFSMYGRHLTDLPCLLPLKRYGVKSYFPVLTALKTYQLIQKLQPFRAPGKGRLFSFNEVAAISDSYATLTPEGALSWCDARVLDSRVLTAAMAEDLRAGGVSVRDNCSVDSIAQDGNSYVATLNDGTASSEVTASVIVNATGPWINHGISGLTPPFPEVLWCKGYNLLLRKKYEDHYAFAWSGNHGAYYFMVPRESCSAIGTAYQPVESLCFPLTLSEEEIGGMIQGINRTFPALSLSFFDVAGYEAGYLPVKKVKDGKPILFGAEKILEKDRIISVLSTKFTTCLTQGEKVARRIDKLLKKA